MGRPTRSINIEFNNSDGQKVIATVDLIKAKDIRKFRNMGEEALKTLVRTITVDDAPCTYDDLYIDELTKLVEEYTALLGKSMPGVKAQAMRGVREHPSNTLSKTGS